MQNPSGIGSPASPRRARFAALGPKRPASAASAAEMGTIRECMRERRWLRLPVTRIPRHRIDHGDLLDGKVRDDLDPVLVHDQHLLDAHAPLMRLAVLCLEREYHPLLDLDGVIERPDARDHWRIVLRQSEPVAPEVGRGLVLFLVAPAFLPAAP